MRLPALLLVLAPAVVVAQPAPPTTPCELAAYQELEAVQARVRTLAKAGLPSRADVTGLIADLPTSYVWSDGGGRLVELSKATDATASAKLLSRIDSDITGILAEGRAWRYRCDAYPTWYVAPKPLTAAQKKQRLAIAKRTKAAHARHAECERLAGKVMALPTTAKRWAYRGALDRCYVDLHAARKTCETDWKGIDTYPVFREQTAVSNVYELRRTRPPTADDVALLRSRIDPMLASLDPPLSQLTGPTRAALKRKDPMQAVGEASGTLSVLLGPCGRLWPHESRCIVTPSACEKHPN